MARRKLRPATEPGALIGLLTILVLVCLSIQMLQGTPGGSGIEIDAIIFGAFAAGILGATIAWRWRQPGSVTPPQPAPVHLTSAEPQTAATPKPAPIVALPRLPPEALMGDTGANERLPLHTVYDGMPTNAFAALCVRQLLRTGWHASVGGRESGARADVIAEREGYRVALQCAMDPLAVGYRAVQQAAAARVDEHAAVGVVVSNAGYTAAAQHLAAQNRILLLNYRDLPALDRLLARSDQGVTAEAV